jgi:hypothetical protein
MPGFGGYIGWSARYVIPVLVAMACLFLAQGWIVRVVGLLIALVIVGINARLIVRYPDPHHP